jgi:hypothetical protein
MEASFFMGTRKSAASRKATGKGSASSSRRAGKTIRAAIDDFLWLATNRCIAQPAPLVDTLHRNSLLLGTELVDRRVIDV